MSNSSFKTNRRNIKRDASCCCQVSRTSGGVWQQTHRSRSRTWIRPLLLSFHFISRISDSEIILMRSWFRQNSKTIRLLCVLFMHNQQFFREFIFLFINIACVALKNPHQMELKETTWHYCLYKKLEDRDEKRNIPHTLYTLAGGRGITGKCYYLLI